MSDMGGTHVPNAMDDALDKNRGKNRLRLETEDGHFVADVAPMLPLEPGPVVFWGERVFLRTDWQRGIGTEAKPIYREIRPTVVFAQHGSC